jgi:hypothetical protein
MKTKKILILASITLVLLALTLSVAVADDEIQALGTCCLPRGGCDWITEPQCDAVNGTWLGPQGSCDQCQPVGGVSEPLQASALLLPAIAVSALAAAGVATALLIKRRAA